MRPSDFRSGWLNRDGVLGGRYPSPIRTTIPARTICSAPILTAILSVSNHSFPLALDIGTGHDASVETDPLIANGVSQLSFPELPICRITGCPDPFADPTKPSTTPFVILTTDPGKGLVTSLCSDVDRTEGPILRCLAARDPYFHNGVARNLSEILDLYNQRFQMNLTDEEKEQLTAFLNLL